MTVVGDVVEQFLERIGAGRLILVGGYGQQHADGAVVDVGRYRAWAINAEAFIAREPDVLADFSNGFGTLLLEIRCYRQRSLRQSRRRTAGTFRSWLRNRRN